MKDFLKPSWQKFIIPLILIIFLILVIISNYDIQKKLTKDYCNLYDLSLQIKQARSSNDSVLFNSTAKQLQDISTENKRVLEENKKKIIFSLWANNILIYAVPIFPVSCEIGIKKAFCGYYIPESQFTCLKGIISESLLSSLFKEPLAYKKPNILLIILSFIWAIIIGYIISCIIALVYKKIKKQRNKNGGK